MRQSSAQNASQRVSLRGHTHETGCDGGSGSLAHLLAHTGPEIRKAP